MFVYPILDQRSLYGTWVLPYVKSKTALDFLDSELYSHQSVKKLKNMDLPERIRDAVDFMLENRAGGPWKHLVVTQLLTVLEEKVMEKKMMEKKAMDKERTN